MNLSLYRPITSCKEACDSRESMIEHCNTFNKSRPFARVKLGEAKGAFV